MRMLVRALLLFAAAALAPPQATPAQAQPDAPEPGLVVVELFTSQGCSSCPPADRLLARLAQDPEVLALSRPVTYWDSLGWRDTLARPEHTAKQRAYQATLSGRPGVYTPQAVVDGEWGGVGSLEAAIRQAVAAARPARAQITLERQGAERLTATVQAPAGARVVLVGFRPSVDVQIGRGENAGRRLRYTNVVTGELVLGRTGAEPARFSAPLAGLRADGAEAFAVIVQAGEAGRILGAARWS
jgi:hypothetical protein